MNKDKNLKAIYKALPYLRVSLPLHISEFMFLLFSSSDSEHFPNPLTISLLLANLSLPRPEYSFLFKLLTTHLACVCGQTSCSSMPLIDLKSIKQWHLLLKIKIMVESAFLKQKIEILTKKKNFLNIQKCLPPHLSLIVLSFCIKYTC